MKKGLLLIALIAVVPACQMRKDNGNGKSTKAMPAQEMPVAMEEVQEVDVTPSERQAMDDQVMQEENMDDVMDVQMNE